jgi:hypothetical protein
VPANLRNYYVSVWRILADGNVAVVRGLIGSTVYELNGEKLETGPRHFMAIWVNEDETWRQVARQHTTVASGLD